MPKYFYVFTFLFLVFGLLFLVYAEAQADARVYFSSPKNVYHPQETQIYVDVLLDSEVEVNALLLEIGYNVQTLAFLSAQNTGSIVNIWQGFPPKTGEGIIGLEGGITNSFRGEAGKVARLIFLPISEGESRIVFRKAILYLADGRATPVWPKMESRTISVSAGAPPPIDIVYDRTRPELYDIDITRNPSDGALILSFRAADDTTGVKEIFVRWRNWIFWGEEWSERSPLTVPSGAWSAQIKVVDGAGNEEIRTVVIWQEAVKKTLLILFVTGAITVVFFRQKTKTKD